MHADIFKNDDPASSTTTTLPACMIWAMAAAAAAAETCTSEPVKLDNVSGTFLVHAVVELKATL